MAVFVLLLIVSVSQATPFLGTVMTYDPKTNNDGVFTVDLRYKTNFQTSCSGSIPWRCLSGDCGTSSEVSIPASEESGGEWCQREGTMTRQISGNDPFQLWLDGSSWTSNINGVASPRALTLVDLRTRSDTGEANRSPHTTVLPVLRVPSNCARQMRLLAFDPDGDDVRCRYGNQSQFECNPCTPPPVLTLSSSCDLSFSGTSSDGEGLYAVQLVMEDFPGQPITLADGSGVVTPITAATRISKIPVQFAFKVDPAVPSCTGGLYLPGFQSPTPANRAQLQASVDHVLQISIKAVALNSAISELLFSGPYNINLTRSGAGDFTLSWTPSESQSGENHPTCFVAQAVSGSNKYHSELRCVIVTVATTAPPTANRALRVRRADPVLVNGTFVNGTAATTTPTTAVQLPTTVVNTTIATTPPPTTVVNTTIATTPPPTTVVNTTIATTPPPTTVVNTTIATTPPPTTVVNTTITTTAPPTTVANTTIATTPPPTTLPPTTVVNTTIATTAPPTTVANTTIATTPPPTTLPPTTVVNTTIATTPPPTTVLNTTIATTPPPTTLPPTTVVNTTIATTPPPTTVLNTTIATTPPPTTPPPTTVVNTTIATTPPPTTVLNTTIATTPPPTTLPPTTVVNTTITTTAPPTTPPPNTVVNTTIATTPPPTTPPPTTVVNTTIATTPPPTTVVNTTIATTPPPTTPPPTTVVNTTIATTAPPTTGGATPSAGQVVLRLKATLTSRIELTADDIRNIVLPALQNQLVLFGVPTSVNLTLVAVL